MKNVGVERVLNRATGEAARAVKERLGLEMELKTLERHLEVYQASRTQRPYYEALFLGKLNELQDRFGSEAGRPFRQFYVGYQGW